MSTPRRPLQTINQFTEANPAFSNGGVRWLLFNREKNGFKKCVVKIGKRVLIDPEKFDEWQREQAEVKSLVTSPNEA